MTKQDIISLLLEDFYERFAEQSGKRIIETNSVSALFELTEDCANHSDYLKTYNREVLKRIEFRAAYVLDYVYFYDFNLFKPFIKRFVTLFPLITNESTKRHFCRIMADILIKGRYIAEQWEYEAVASACVDWIINSKVRVAVQIWAIECLFLLQSKVLWVREILDDILDNLSVNPSPAMVVRLRRWKYPNKLLENLI